MNDKVQPLGLTRTDMIDQATVDVLNAEVREVLALGEAQVYADVALRQVGDKHGMVLADTTSATDTDGGYVELWRLPDGRYTTVWFVSQFGAADAVNTPEQYEADAVGFDNQTLGWGETA